MQEPDPLTHVIKIQDALSFAIQHTNTLVDALTLDEKLVAAHEVRRIAGGIHQAAEACVGVCRELQEKKFEDAIARILTPDQNDDEGGTL